MNEQDYERGSRAAWWIMLRTCLKELYGVKPSGELAHARLVAEREEALMILRSACEIFGDNDWSSDLMLPDIIEKHLVRHLHAGSK